MTKYFPGSTFAPAEVIETEALNSEFRSAVSIINRLDRENFAKNIIDDVKMVPESCNSFYTDYHEGPITYDSQVVHTGWWNIPHLTFTITTEEGMMRGAFSGTIEKYCHDTAAMPPASKTDTIESGPVTPHVVLCVSRPFVTLSPHYYRCNFWITIYSDASFI